MPTLPADRARALCLAVLRHLRFTDVEATDCADAIMFATLRGLDTHGIISILPAIANSVAAGRIEPRATILTLRESAVVAAYRGNGAAGPAIAAHAMRAAIARAREHGIGLTVAANCNHFGAASAYAAMALAEDMIGLVACNAGPVVAPFGGASPLHGTNPIAYAAPGGSAPPMVLDIATSAAAHGQIAKAQRRGQPIPLGWALDESGAGTTDPAAAKVLLPFGAHKGYGIGVLVDLLTGALTGTTIGKGVRQGDPDRLEGGQAFFFQAINVGFFTEPDTYKAKVDQLYQDMQSIAPAAGFSEVLAPGELEWRSQQARLASGIPLYDADWAALASGLAKGGIPDSIIAAHAPNE
ncbi:MAG: Ldh family oxidoreductase [Chloroflexi bacterium]|nr:Ldh family oxidoreductase [Chloroflexota bacterium]